MRSFLKKKVGEQGITHSQSQKSLREYTTEGYELQERNEVLKHIADPPVTVEPLQEVSQVSHSHTQGDDPDMDVLVCYRSLLVCVNDQDHA